MKIEDTTSKAKISLGYHWGVWDHWGVWGNDSQSANGI